VLAPVTVGRYKPGEPMPGEAHEVTGGSGQDNPDGPHWLGWVEAPDWILYELSDGTVYVFNGRRPEGGVRGPAVIIGRSTADGMPPAPVVVPGVV